MYNIYICIYNDIMKDINNNLKMCFHIAHTNAQVHILVVSFP